MNINIADVAALMVSLHTYPQQEYHAVLLVIGQQECCQTRIPQYEHETVYRAIDLLHKITSGDPFELPQGAVVIGGGNVAMDIAHSLA